MSSQVDAFLEHHGVKGQKWGIRNDSRASGEHAPNASRTVNRHAQKDAKEFARAKAFFGEGAGTRRKLIKQTIESKTKNMPGYKEALDFHLGKQDQAKHVTKAKTERKNIDRVDKNKKRISAVARRITHEPGTQAAFVALALSGAAYLHSQQGRVHLTNAAKKMSNAAYKIKQKRGAARIKKFLDGGAGGNADSMSNKERSDIIRKGLMDTVRPPTLPPVPHPRYENHNRIRKETYDAMSKKYGKK